MNSIAILGIGNTLLQDDGAGIHALNHFATHNAFPGVDCLDAGTVGLALLDGFATSLISQIFPIGITEGGNLF